MYLVGEEWEGVEDHLIREEYWKAFMITEKLGGNFLDFLLK